MTARKRFRIAFVGIDHPHAAGWRRAIFRLPDELAITAIVPRYDGGTASLEERISDVPRFATVEQLLDGGEFDGAIICLPNDESPAATLALVEAGKHALVEKPAAASAADFRPIVAAANKSGVAFQNGYMWRYDDAIVRLRRMVADGRFGPLVSVEMLFVTSNVARRGPEHYLFNASKSGGGFFNWLACHWLDLLLHVTGEEVVAVTARVGNYSHAPVDVEDGGVAILELSGGGVVSFIGGYWLPRWTGESHWCVRGRDRWVHWHPARPGTGGVLEIHGPQPQWDAMEETYIVPEDHAPGYGGSRTVALLRDWIAAARGGSFCRNTPQSTLATLELIDTIYESSRQGRRIECRIADGGQATPI